MGPHAPCKPSLQLFNAFNSAVKSAVKIGTQICALGMKTRNLRELMNTVG